ncbi:DUF1749 domain-containing protein [Lyngbya aestuarii]|uniref:DUF1749 domain-containing protein n=1 Tax=Lyngbya aestuarii TaxID=118322 RepID=UPI00403DE588
MFKTYLLPLSENELNQAYTKRLPCSLLWQPTSPQIKKQKLAVIYLHDWNGYPYSALACHLGSELASRGFVFLSLGMHRRGVEGQMTAVPDDDLEDLHRGVQYLSSRGCSEIILIGEGIGALTAVRYQSQIQNSCLQGIVLIHPFPDLATWLENTIGEERYQSLVEKSSSEIIAGSEGEAWIDLTLNSPSGNPFLIYQSFESWLSWWGSNADSKTSIFVESSTTPLLLITGKEVPFKISNNTNITAHLDEGNLAEVIDSWVNKLNLAAANQFELVSSDVTEPMEIVTIQTSDGSNLVGLFWENDSCRQHNTAVLHVRGKTGTPITEPLFTKLAEVYNQNNLAALVIELRRSGYGGSLEATAEMDVADIDAFVELLVERGYSRIILSGQSLGSNSIMRYQVQRHHANAIALVHMAPTRDCAEWLEQHIGSENYDSLVAEAKTAIAEGRGEQGLIGKPPYQWMLSPQRPNSWLSWWGPEADTVNSHTISQVNIPILLLCGSKDFFNDRERLNHLQKAATHSPNTKIIWYEGCGHNFAGFEQQTARDVVLWLKEVEQNNR